MVDNGLQKFSRLTYGLIPQNVAKINGKYH